MGVKQVIVIRKDLKMRRGKEIAQGAHASMAWLVKRLTDFQPGPGYGVVSMDISIHELAWLNGDFRKVVCQVDSEQELHDLHTNASVLGLEARLITDLGMTEFNGVPTVTALAIGPDLDAYIDPITSHLKLY